MTPRIKNNNITKTYYLRYRYIFSKPDETARGLMYIKSPLPNDEAALFMMNETKIQSFWMKNTYIPLDMIFLSSQGVVMGFYENARPFNLSPHKINLPSKYVIEVNSGFIKKYNIEKGDIIKLPIENQKLIF